MTKISGEIVYLSDFNEDADKALETWGVTDLYSTNSPDIDGYIGGGYGRKAGYEIVVLFGDTGIGKSTFALNMLYSPVQAGKRVGLLILEDSGSDVNAKMTTMFGRDFINEHKKQLLFTPKQMTDGSKVWNLDQLLDQIESWFTDLDVEVILLDHLQFAFESAISLKGDNEYIAQRVFVRKINAIMTKLAEKGVSKTIILVNHVNKNTTAKGMGKIVGSAAIAGSATKVMEVYVDGTYKAVRLWKSRFTATPSFSHAFQFDVRQRLAGANNESYHEEERNAPEPLFT